MPADGLTAARSFKTATSARPVRAARCRLRHVPCSRKRAPRVVIGIAVASRSEGAASRSHPLRKDVAADLGAPDSYRCESGAGVVTGFQPERLDSCFGKRPPRFNRFIRGHHVRNNCRGLCRVSFSHEENRANRRAAVQRRSFYEDNLTICHALLYRSRGAVSRILSIDPHDPAADARARSDAATLLHRRGPNTKYLKWEAEPLLE